MASTSLTFDSEVYAYSRSKGLFAGVSLEGSGIFINNKANRRFYDGGKSATAILSATGTPPAPADELMAEVRRVTSVAQQAAVEPAKPEAEAAPAEAHTYPMPDPEPGKEPQ